MATDAKFQKPELIPVPQQPEYHPEIAASEHDGLHFWQFMIAGSIAGMVEHMAMFPVDTIKTQMQALGSCPINSVGIRQALQSILKSDGPKGLYRGIGAMGLGAGPAHAVYFSVYEFCKKSFSRGNPDNHAAHAVSGVCATVVSDAVLTPMDMVKQRLQLSSSPYKGVWDCVRRVLREEGLRAFYASYRTTILMNAPFTAVHFATYEAAKRGLMEVSPESVSDERLVVHATAGAAAGALAAVLTTPLDVVKTQLQCQICVIWRLYQSLLIKSHRSASIFRGGATGKAECAGLDYCFQLDLILWLLCPLILLYTVMGHRFLESYGCFGGDGGKGFCRHYVVVIWLSLCGGLTVGLVKGVCGCDRFVNGSIGDVVRTIVKKDGYRGLMRGWTPRMLFHAPAAAICWSTYEASKSFFQEINDAKTSANVT
ncbi:hypothetical protein BUALT_Bualt02G0071300 [Buddleja alternifolia]|uniref:Mitochondrial carrier protein n=1 Tax=Buddleja alternifolia TaxID=168488 RepID=A0AAV6XZR1_9LAMI|nr:hypothetical protein BUALT_Bualt02G0071300 [Buddleja alternifolia]